MANKQVLMQLLEMLSQSTGRFADRRQQAGQFRAGMKMDQARLEAERKRDAERLKASIADRKIRREDLELRIKEADTLDNLKEREGRQQAETVEYMIAQEAHPETSTAFTQRGAAKVREGVTPGVDKVKDLSGMIGALKDLGTMGKNIPGAMGIAAQGPATLPGETKGQFLQREMDEGVPAEDLFKVAGMKAPKTDFAQLNAAFDYYTRTGKPYEQIDPIHKKDISETVYNRHISYRKELIESEKYKALTDKERTDLTMADLRNKVEAKGIYAPRPVATTPTTSFDDLFPSGGKGPDGGSGGRTELPFDVEQVTAGIRVGLKQGIGVDVLKQDLMDSYGLSADEAQALMDSILVK